MYAIVRAGGRQEKVAVGDVLNVDRLDGEPPVWDAELRARLGPLARSKRLRMVRTVHDSQRRVVRFERQELLARLRALTRRTKAEAAAEAAGGVQAGAQVLSFEGLTLDLQTREVTRNGRRISLTRTEFALLQTFLENPRRVLERGWLLNEVWGFDFPGGTRTVDTSVRKLLASRRQIDDLAARKKSGMSIIPTKLLTTGNYIKLVIALGRGKKLYDKRQTLKKRAEERDTRRTV